MDGVVSSTSNHNKASGPSRCALIGTDAEPSDPEEETAGCSSGKELVVYSKAHILPYHDSCRTVIPEGSDSEVQPVMMEFCWDSDWAW